MESSFATALIWLAVVILGVLVSLAKTWWDTRGLATGRRWGDLIRIDNALEEAVRGAVPTTEVTSGLMRQDEIELTVKDEVERAVASFQMRVEKIEERFPDATEIDKIASINDAVLATKIETIQRQIEKIEKRLDDDLVTKWQVALIVFAILSAVGGVVALVNFIQR